MMRRFCRLGLLVVLSLPVVACSSRPAPATAPHGAAPRDAFRQFDPPAPGVANRPELGLGGRY
jgi:hypothetical protein